jgi:hypothetical protein
MPRHMTNKEVLADLVSSLKAMDFFALYPSRRDLKNYIEQGVSDTDKIRRILRDDMVQREIFPNWAANRDRLDDPVQAYRDLRQNPDWPETDENKT